MIATSVRRQRGGFTLVELLTVFAIVAVLIALSAGAAVKVIDGQRTVRTEDGLRIMDKALHQHWNKVIEEAKKDFDDNGPSDAVLAMAANDKNRAKVLWIIFRLTESFPQSYAEVKTPPIYGIDTANRYWIPFERRKYIATYNRVMFGRGNGNNAATQSAACLWMALTQVNRGGLKLAEDGLPANIADTDKDNVKEFVDGWVVAINFQRFPIGNTELSGMNPRKGTLKQNFGDPLDPDGTLVQMGIPANTSPFPTSVAWTANQRWFQGTYDRTTKPPTTYGALLKTLCQYQPMFPQPYHLPLITSNGHDGLPNTGDDILNIRLRLGARGD